MKKKEKEERKDNAHRKGLVDDIFLINNPQIICNSRAYPSHINKVKLHKNKVNTNLFITIKYHYVSYNVCLRRIFDDRSENIYFYV